MTIIDQEDYTPESEPTYQLARQELGQSQLTRYSTAEIIDKLAKVAHESRMFNTANQNAAAVIMLRGAAFGLSDPFQAFALWEMVNGKLRMRPEGMLALIHASGKIEVSFNPKNDATVAEVTMRRKDTGFTFTASFTIEQAIHAGLVRQAGTTRNDGSVRQQGSAWESYPERMLMWRVVGFCASVVCPDILNGMTRKEWRGEIVDVTEPEE